MAWYFFTTYPHGTVFTDVNGTTFDAGDTWTTKVTPERHAEHLRSDRRRDGMAAPLTIDPALGMVYFTTGTCAAARATGRL